MDAARISGTHTMDVDRLAPALRASCGRRPTGRQTWRDLLFVQWEFPFEALRALVPRASRDSTPSTGAPTSASSRSRCTTCASGPLPVRDFLDVNVRTYVHAGGVPGVWFFSLDAQSRLAVWGARAFFRLPYHRARACGNETRGASTTYSSAREGLGGPTALEVCWTMLDAEPYTPRSTGPWTTSSPSAMRFTARCAAEESIACGCIHRAWSLGRARLDGLSSTLSRAARLDAGEPIPLVLASPEGVAVETFAKEPVAISRADRL
jgi:uncharacterized protein